MSPTPGRIAIDPGVALSPAEAAFGVVLEPADLAAPDPVARIRARLDAAGDHDLARAIATLAELRARAGYRWAPLAPLARLGTALPGWRRRRRTWALVRSHALVERLRLPAWAWALAMLPTALAAPALGWWMAPDLSAALLVWASFLLLGLMLTELLRRLVGWAFPAELRTVADLARRLAEDGADPWTPQSIAARLAALPAAGPPAG